MRVLARRVPCSYRTLALFLLLPLLLLLVVGFAPAAQMNEDEALKAAASDPEVEKLLSQPTVKPSGDSGSYDQSSDSWHVILTQESTQMRVAELWVADDTGEVENVDIFSPAEALEAVEVAAADSRVRQELAKYDSPNYASAKLEEGEWTVLFVVEDSDPAGGM